MTPADVLEAAADALFVHGRAIGLPTDEAGRLCVEGAMCFVQGRHPNMWQQCRLSDEVEALRAFVGMAPFDWNDRLESTPDNDAVVIDTLKRCAKALREVES